MATVLNRQTVHDWNFILNIVKFWFLWYSMNFYTRISILWLLDYVTFCQSRFLLFSVLRAYILKCTFKFRKKLGVTMIDGTGYQIFFADTYKLNGLNKEGKIHK